MTTAEQLKGLIILELQKSPDSLESILDLLGWARLTVSKAIELEDRKNESDLNALENQSYEG